MSYQKEENVKGEIKIVSLRDRVDAIQRMNDNTFTSVLVYQAGMRKSIVLNLVERDLLFTEIHYGAGVYRIIRENKND
jgi:carbamoylphosphate synthase small subunit